MDSDKNRPGTGTGTPNLPLRRTQSPNPTDFSAVVQTALTHGPSPGSRPGLQSGAALPLSKEMDQLEKDFLSIQEDYQRTLITLKHDDYSKFREEYEKMSQAVLKSREHVHRLFKQYEELYSEHVANSNSTQEAIKTSIGDQQTISQLKTQVKDAEDLILQSNKREESSKEDLQRLKAEIASLGNILKQGVGLSALQERTLNELIQTKEQCTKELDAELEKIVHYRNAIVEATDKIRQTDQQKRGFEKDIFELKDKIATKKADIEAETRNKERLERDLRELRVVVAVKSQEVRGKQDAVNRGNEDVSLLLSQIKNHKQMLEKLAKDQESLVSRTLKLQKDCDEQMTLSAELAEQNTTYQKELVEKEQDLVKIHAEVRRVVKLRDALVKKSKLLEEQKVASELERKTLRQKNDSTLSTINVLQRRIDLDGKVIDDLVREHDIVQENFKRVSGETANHAHLTLLHQQQRHNINLELERYRREHQALRRQIADCGLLKDGYVSEMTRVQALCLAALHHIKQKEVEIYEFKKKMVVADTKLKYQQNLYEAVISDRNLHSKHLIESQAEIMEMKRKLKIMNFQINGYKEEINTKESLLLKEIVENGKLERDIELITKGIQELKSHNQLSLTYLKSQLLEESKLNQFVKEAEAERHRQEHALSVLVMERDNLSQQLIRQNDELATVYGKIKIQHSSLIRSERFYQDKLAALQRLRDEIRGLRHRHAELSSQTATLDNIKGTLHHLQSDLVRERTRMKALEEELENPMNVHRWRKLEGSNPKAFEMIQLLHTLQKRLIGKTKEDLDKEAEIHSKEQSYLTLKSLLAKQVGPEALEQISEFQQLLKDKTLQLKHMGTELNMYQAQVREYKHSISALDKSLSQVKRDFIAQNRGKLYDLKRLYPPAAAGAPSKDQPPDPSLPPLPTAEQPLSLTPFPDADHTDHADAGHDPQDPTAEMQEAPHEQLGLTGDSTAAKEGESLPGGVAQHENGEESVAGDGETPTAAITL